MHPLIILLVGLVTVVGLILVVRLNAFVALIVAAMAVSLLAPGPWEGKIGRVADAFGTSAGKIGVVIALAAVIGRCMMQSGAADRIVRSFLRLLGAPRAPVALAATGFVLSIPVFFDTVFYLTVPLARSLFRQTRKDYLLYILAIGAGAVVTHVMVPPTPGPLAIASMLNIDLGVMILTGIALGIPTSIIGLAMARWFNRRMEVPMRPYPGEVETEPLPDAELPPLGISLAPIVLPVLLISANTVTGLMAGAEAHPAWRTIQAVSAVLGNANLALLVSAGVAMGLLVRTRNLTFLELARATEEALMSAGVIILITAAGGAFGAMLAEAEIGQMIEQMAASEGKALGMTLLGIAFAASAVMKTAQGSSTVAMLTTAGLVQGMDVTPEALGFHPVYLAVAIATGSLVFCWMNDSGFWVVARMSGMTEKEALKAWTPLVATIGIGGMGATVLAAWLVPLT